MPETIAKIITHHFQRYPQMQIQDWYKLLFQAAMGIEHLLRDPAPILHNLQQELAAVTPTLTTQLTEPISPELVRVHLGPFKARIGQPEQLVQLMIKSAQNFQPSKTRLENYWEILMQLAAEKIISASVGELRTFFNSKQSAGLPAVHHSSIFRENYRPAYRIILRKFLAKLLFAE